MDYDLPYHEFVEAPYDKALEFVLGECIRARVQAELILKMHVSLAEDCGDFHRTDSREIQKLSQQIAMQTVEDLLARWRRHVADLPSDDPAEPVH